MDVTRRLRILRWGGFVLFVVPVAFPMLSIYFYSLSFLWFSPLVSGGFFIAGLIALTLACVWALKTRDRARPLDVVFGTLMIVLAIVSTLPVAMSIFQSLSVASHHRVASYWTLPHIARTAAILALVVSTGFAFLRRPGWIKVCVVLFFAWMCWNTVSQFRPQTNPSGVNANHQTQEVSTASSSHKRVSTTYRRVSNGSVYVAAFAGLLVVYAFFIRPRLDSFGDTHGGEVEEVDTLYLGAAH